MKIKTSEATPLQLNWLVAKIEGWLHFDATGHPWDADNSDPDGDACWFEPTVNWSQGGPIIERECICTYASGACSVAPKNPDYWVAEILDTSEMITQYGPTPLIAAMRCYCASKLGDEVDVPDELLGD